MSWRHLAVATEAVLRAGRIQRQRYGSGVPVEYKGEIDLVTEVDRACELAIVELLRSRYPGHDIVTEETDLARTGSRHVWFIDPLDGTTNFAHSYPMFCTSVALAVEGEIVAGAVYDPVREELFTGEKGAGSHLNGRRLSVSTASELIRSLLITGFPYDLHERLAERLRLFNRVMGLARAVRRDGSAALDLCYVAAGRADGFWEEVLKPWDMHAGRLILCEAGGKATRLDGTPLGLGPDGIVATNGLIQAALVAALREEPSPALV
ncbi:MAG: inositol monophosphatase family protein [Betaproteobacteria bacterium]